MTPSVLLSLSSMVAPYSTQSRDQELRNSTHSNAGHLLISVFTTISCWGGLLLGLNLFSLPMSCESLLARQEWTYLFQQGLNTGQQQVPSRIGGVSMANRVIIIPQKVVGVVRAGVNVLSCFHPGWEWKRTQF